MKCLEFCCEPYNLSDDMSLNMCKRHKSNGIWNQILCRSQPNVQIPWTHLNKIMNKSTFQILLLYRKRGAVALYSVYITEKCQMKRNICLNCICIELRQQIAKDDVWCKPVQDDEQIIYQRKLSVCEMHLICSWKKQRHWQRDCIHFFASSFCNQRLIKSCASNIRAKWAFYRAKKKMKDNEWT